MLAEDGAAGLVDQLAGVGAREAAVGEQAGDDDARRGRADGAGEQALGRLHRLGVALRRRAALVLAVARQRAEGGVGALAADVAGRELVQVGERGGARRRLAAGAVGGDADEALGLAELGRGRLGRERDRDVERDVRADAPQQAVELGVEREAAEGDGAEPADAERAVGQQVGRQPAGGGEGRHRDGPDPAEEAGADPGDRSGRGRAAPEQAADQRRRELGDGGEGDQADGGEREGRGDDEVAEVGERHDPDDGDAAGGEERRAGVRLPAGAQPGVAGEQRQDQVVGDHGAEGEGRDDDHAGRRREAAEEGDEGEHRPAELARDRDHEGVGLRAAVGEEREAGDRDRKHEEVDGDEVEREGPGGGADVVDVGVLHHRDVELARQAEEGERGQHAGRPPALVEGVEAEQPHEVGVGAHGGGEPAGRAEGEEGDGAADEERRGELDDRLGRDREHQAAVRLVGVDAAHPEEHGEGRHRGGDDQRGAAGQPADVAGERLEADGDRLELQREVGEEADRRGGGDDHGDGAALAVARGDEVGDRDQVLGAGDADHARDQWPAEAHDEDRADVDGEIVEAALGGDADGAVEGPGGAVDADRQRVDRGCPARRPGPAVAGPGDQEQERQIGQRQRQDDPVEHRAHRSGRPSLGRGRPAVTEMRGVRLA